MRRPALSSSLRLRGISYAVSVCSFRPTSLILLCLNYKGANALQSSGIGRVAGLCVHEAQ